MTTMNSYRAIEPQNAKASVEELCPLICSKSLRLRLLNTTMNNNAFRSLRFHHGSHADICDINSGADPFDIILVKVGDCTDQSCTQDAQFERNEKLTPSTPLSFVHVPSGMHHSHHLHGKEAVLELISETIRLLELRVLTA